MKKVCTKCGIEKELEEFYKQKTGKYGVTSRCKVCDKKRRKKYRKQIKEYRERNKGKMKEYQKEYYEQNKEKLKEYARVYRTENVDKRKKYEKGYRERNAEKIKDYRQKYLRTDRGRLSSKIANHKRREKVKLNGGSFTPEEWQEAKDFFGNKCAWSGIPLTGKNESIEHLIPVNKGGTLNINNIIPCDLLINRSRRDNNWEEWYPKQPFYSKEREERIKEWIELKTK